MSKQGYYGFPNVEDPNDFSPDAESSSPAEIAAHKLACQTYGTAAYEPNKGCFEERSEDGSLMKHVLRTSWGIGINIIRICDECNFPFFGERSITCHKCGNWTDFCEDCWPKHEERHDLGTI